MGWRIIIRLPGLLSKISEEAIYPLGKTQDISAVLSNSIQTTPVLLTARYFPSIQLPLGHIFRPGLALILLIFGSTWENLAANKPMQDLLPEVAWA